MRIHDALTAGGYPNTTTLARDLEVSPKTVQRDLEFMRDRLNLPLAYDNRRFGYHYTEKVEGFPTLRITEGELFALLVAEKALQQYRGSPFEKRLVGAFRKLTRSLPDTISFNLADWDQTISFRTSAEPVFDPSIIEVIALAAARGRQLRLEYRKPNTRQGETRVVDPYHLANVNGDWYLFAFDHLRQAVRTFVPSRIQKLEPTGETFQRPASFTLDRQLRDSFAILSAEGRFGVVIRFDASVADYVREKRWHPSQDLTDEPDGGVLVRLQLGSLNEIERWVLGWGGRATVLEPPELVASIRQAAQRLLGRQPPASGPEDDRQPPG